MSDTSQGAGWWLASDGKWYAPELAPHPPPPPQSHVSEISAQQTRPTTIQQAPTPSLPSSDMRATAASDPAPQQALVSDRSLGEGWWQASNGRWYAPEIYPSTTPRDGWWQGTSGKWWAPMFHPTNAPQGSVPTVSATTRTSNGSAPQQTLVSDRSMGGGWWQATDGKWYAPEVHPSDTPQGDGWWQATNGKWYTPMFYPTNAAQNGAAQNGAALTHQEANPGNTANTPLPVCAPPAASAPTLGSPQAAHGADYVETLTPFADSAKKKRSFRLHWRKMTWAIVIFNAIMLIWIIADGERHLSHLPQPESAAMQRRNEHGQGHRCVRSGHRLAHWRRHPRRLVAGHEGPILPGLWAKREAGSYGMHRLRHRLPSTRGRRIDKAVRLLPGDGVSWRRR